jgi:hypothetical protein
VTPEQRAKHAKYQREWRARQPLEKRRAAEHRHGGLPESPYPRPTHCECCGKLPGKLGLQLDHCHKTGLFRGWLCFMCNSGIGKLGDTVEGLERAITYLRRAQVLDLGYERRPGKNHR